MRRMRRGRDSDLCIATLRFVTARGSCGTRKHRHERSEQKAHSKPHMVSALSKGTDDERETSLGARAKLSQPRPEACAGL